MRRMTLTVVTLMLFAVTATAAQADAPFELVDRVTGLECSQDGGEGELVIDGSDVSGGCLDEDWRFAFAVGNPNATWVPCQVYADIRIDSTGALYVVNQENGYSGSVCAGISRQLCNDPNSAPLPWPGELRAGSGPNDLEIEFQMCLEHMGTPFYPTAQTFAVTLDESPSPWIRRLDQISPAVAPGDPFWGEAVNGDEYGENPADDDVIIYY